MTYRKTIISFESTHRIGMAYASLLRELRLLEVEETAVYGPSHSGPEFDQEVENQMGRAIREIYEMSKDV